MFSTGSQNRVRIPPATLAFAVTLAVPAFAQGREDGLDQCGDNTDNDGDGLIDCADPDCRGSNLDCPAPDRAFVVGIGAEWPAFRFDAPMTTAATTPGGQLLPTELDGPGPQANDLIVGGNGEIAVFRSLQTVGKVSLPRSPTLQGVLANARFATGDIGGDGLADLVVVGPSAMRRYAGDGAGGFSAVSNVTASPGPGGGVPAVVGRYVAVANARLRLYGQCNQPHPDFPVDETFGLNGLCASVGLPLNERPTVVLGFVDSLNVRYLAVVFDTIVRIYRVDVAAAVQPVVIGIVNVGTPVKDLAFSRELRALVMAREDGRLQVVRVGPTGVDSVTSLPPLALADSLSHLALDRQDGRTVVVALDGKGERIAFVPFSLLGWDEGDMATLIVGRGRDVAVGRFNGDALLDVAVLQEDSSVRLFRQTPKPCATFITSASHGLVTNLDGPAHERPSLTYLARFSKALAHRAADINKSRRPVDAFRDVPASQVELCPIRHIEVRGHWERDALPNLTVPGRAGWIGSMLVPTPLCHPPLIPLLAQTPFDYWVSAIFLIVPEVTPLCAPDFLLPGDPGARVRFLVGGLGAGLEAIGRGETSQGSRHAAVHINDAFRAAIADADARMSPSCDGHIYLDIAAHSRGTAVNTEALRYGFGQRANYNFDLSLTLIDAIDPSHGDQFRPFTRAGYIVGDPVITRVGSEWTSSFHMSRALPVGSPMDELVGLAPPHFETPEYKAVEAIGLPLGRPRKIELEDPLHSFNAFQGPYSALGHVEAAENENGYLNPSNIDDAADQVKPDGAKFAFAETTFLGKLLQQPRLTLPIPAVGFHTSSNFSTAQELLAMPPACGGQGSRAHEVGGPGSGAAAGKSRREMVRDGDFRKSTGVVRNANDLLIEDPTLDRLPKLQWFKDFVFATAAAKFPAGGAWEREGMVSFPATGPTLEQGMRTFIARSGVQYETMNSAQVQAEQQAWQQELQGPMSGAAGSHDVVRGLSAGADRSNDGTDAFAAFGASTSKLRQRLSADARSHDRFLARLEYALGSAVDGAVTLAFTGPGVSASVSPGPANGLGRRVVELDVRRQPGVPVGDIALTITGRNVRVFSVSVRPEQPVASSTTGAFYELVLLDEGATWQTADQLARRQVYQGRAGRLARIGSLNQLAELSVLLKPDVPAWIDGRSPDGSAGSFRDSVNNTLPAGLFLPGTSFTEPRPRGAHAFTWPVQAGMRLGHTGPAVSVKDAPMAFIVEYAN